MPTYSFLRLSLFLYLSVSLFLQNKKKWQKNIPAFDMPTYGFLRLSLSLSVSLFLQNKTKKFPPPVSLFLQNKKTDLCLPPSVSVSVVVSLFLPNKKNGRKICRLLIYRLMVSSVCLCLFLCLCPSLFFYKTKNKVS